MRKFIGVFVAVMMCVVMCLPMASAASGVDALGDVLGVDVSGLTNGELSSLLGDLDLQGLDLDSITGSLGALKGDDGIGTEGIEAVADDLAASLNEVDVEGTVENALSGVLGGVDTSWLDDLTGLFNLGSVEEALSGITGENGGDFVSTITGVFDSIGLGDIDLSSFDIGSFDISSVLGDLNLGGGSSSGSEGDDSPKSENPATSALSGIADTILGGLQSLGIDTSLIEGLLDNEIVNFFANMYIGFVGNVDEPATEAPVETTEAPAETTTEKVEPSTEAPVTPKTGDTSTSVVVAIGTFSVAAAAAFVCLKKKRA